MKPLSVVPCAPRLPDEPEGYIGWHSWAAEKVKTHRQEQCPECSLFRVWIERAPWERAVAEAVEAEREACAKAIEAMLGTGEECRTACSRCRGIRSAADEIRARGDS